jgi:iron-sulfur cluster repair protein YtfE (RIC family)
MKSESEEWVYVEHLTAEHRRLDQLIHQTLARLPNWEQNESSDWPAELITGLAAIRDELARHFQEEEAGGCLEEAASLCPGLSSEVTAIEADHARLLTELDELINRARQLTKPTAREAHALGQELRALANDLHAHEARENQIMQRGFGVGLENDDDA